MTREELIEFGKTLEWVPLNQRGYNCCTAERLCVYRTKGSHCWVNSGDFPQSHHRLYGLMCPSKPTNPPITPKGNRRI